MRRRRDTTLTFASLHNLRALIATGEIDAAWELVDALATSAAQAEGDQGQVMEAVGIELATTLLDLGLNRGAATLRRSRPVSRASAAATRNATCSCGRLPSSPRTEAIRMRSGRSS